MKLPTQQRLHRRFDMNVISFLILGERNINQRQKRFKITAKTFFARFFDGVFDLFLVAISVEKARGKGERTGIKTGQSSRPSWKTWQGHSLASFICHIHTSFQD
jgi:hypothetical protein